MEEEEEEVWQWDEEEKLEKRDGGEGVRGRRWRKRIGGVGGRARSDGRRITSEEKEQARTNLGEGAAMC